MANATALSMEDPTSIFAPLPDFAAMNSDVVEPTNAKEADPFHGYPSFFPSPPLFGSFNLSGANTMRDSNINPIAPIKIKRKRNRKTLSCECCRARKVKCDRSYPCRHCVLRKQECIWGKGTPKHIHTPGSLLDQLDNTPATIKMDANGNFYHSYPDKLDASHSTINTGIRGRARGSSFGSNASTSITVPSTASYDSGYSTDTPQQHMYVPRQPNPLPSASLQQLTDQRAGPKSDLDALIGALSSVENGHVNLVSDWPAFDFFANIKSPATNRKNSAAPSTDPLSRRNSIDDGTIKMPSYVTSTNTSLGDVHGRRRSHSNPFDGNPQLQPPQPAQRFHRSASVSHMQCHVMPTVAEHEPMPSLSPLFKHTAGL